MITIDVLKPYLNTNLQGVVNYDFSTIHTMEGLSTNLVYTNLITTPINTFIPIMRNLDFLIKPNMYSGENINVIPLFEIAKIYANDIDVFSYLTKIEMPDDCDDYGKTLYACGWKNTNNEEIKFFYSKEKCSFFSSKMGKNEPALIIPNQLKYFNILYFWNFWLGSDEYFKNNEIIDINNI